MTENAVRKLRDAIENDIVAGVFAPGEKLDELQVAKRFGVSRTPVREALMQLSAIGVVELRPRRGAVVADHGPQRVYEMFEVMAELEGLAGAHAARRYDAGDREALTQAHERCREAAEQGEFDAYYYDNEVFHHAIYAASHSAFLAEQCGALHRRLRPYRRLQLRVRNRLKISFEEHAAILEAIFAGDGDAARARLRSHVVVQGDRFGDLLSAFATRDPTRSAS
ncbi:GntR family transcriptional regulator [Hansschlegelia sp. KR7-227]|jgi:DNA-binding GntR family transcriptional regulator|uniref:GntR family transcriptional regulator n=1 Tax=Hansschlegelia sp. KR7-227 TaxID=3400914 RepID=UPI003C0F89D6